MPTFPLPFKPKQDYHRGGVSFGWKRDGGARKHAACDLIAPKGTEIYAVEDGEVVSKPYPFYHGTFALEFKLTASGRIVRYGEISKAAKGVAVGSKLKEGDVIAYVGKMYKSSMLHFEMYEGTAAGGLTDRSNPPFQRRKDLMNPTDYLDSCTPYNVLAANLAIQAVADAVASFMGGMRMPVRWIR
jgi:murein DD-endopeptidase MepM/ murein hydrolase activator NlpD